MLIFHRLDQHQDHNHHLGKYSNYLKSSKLNFDVKFKSILAIRKSPCISILKSVDENFQYFSVIFHIPVVIYHLLIYLKLFCNRHPSLFLSKFIVWWTEMLQVKRLQQVFLTCFWVWFEEQCTQVNHKFSIWSTLMCERNIHKVYVV